MQENDEAPKELENIEKEIESEKIKIDITAQNLVYNDDLSQEFLSKARHNMWLAKYGEVEEMVKQYSQTNVWASLISAEVINRKRKRGKRRFFYADFFF